MPRSARTPVRLQKLIADAGVASRRAAEALIAEGRVSVNGTVVTTPGTTAIPGRDLVTVDGVPLRPPEQRTYVLLHKPAGYTSTLSDPHAERTVIDLLPRSLPRVYPVGRLDRDSEGLLLLTDDGPLTERLLHPRHGLEREYAVLVRGTVSETALNAIRRGAIVEGARVVPVDVRVTLPPDPIEPGSGVGTRWLRITVAEGRKREVRALCAEAHLFVLRLVRVRFGPLTLAGLLPKKARRLTEDELTALRAATTPGPPAAAARPPAARPTTTPRTPAAARPKAAARPAGRTSAPPPRTAGPARRREAGLPSTAARRRPGPARRP